MSKYQPLRDALAAGPTPGPWHAPGLAEVHDADCRCIAMCSDCDPVEEELRPVPSIAEGERMAKYIVAADPDTIRDLLADADRAAALEAERDRLREALRWTAAVLNDAADSPYCVDEEGLIKIGDETRTVSQILDAADAALAQEQGESNEPS